MKVTEVTSQVLDDVLHERYRQDSKFGDNQINDPEFDLRRNAVLVEEVGEVSENLNEQFLGNDVTDDELYDELVQVAVVAASWAEGLIRLGRVERS